jgi:hypothetical protein
MWEYKSSDEENRKHDQQENNYIHIRRRNNLFIFIKVPIDANPDVEKHEIEKDYLLNEITLDRQISRS